MSNWTPDELDLTNEALRRTEAALSERDVHAGGATRPVAVTSRSECAEVLCFECGAVIEGDLATCGSLTCATHRPGRAA